MLIQSSDQYLNRDTTLLTTGQVNMGQTNVSQSTSAPANTPAAERLTLESRMQSSLLAISRSWGKSKAATDSLALRDFYLKCLDVVEVQSKPVQYGGDGVKLLFDVHDLHRDTIRDYANVGERIDKEFFNAVDKHNAALQPGQVACTPTHLVRFARLADPGTRLRLLAKFKTEGWGANRLNDEVTKCISQKVDGVDGDTVEDAPPARPTRPTAETYKMSLAASKLVDSLMPIDNDFFLPRLDAVKPKDMAQAIENMEATKSALETLETKIADNIVTLDSGIQTMKRKYEHAMLTLAAKKETTHDPAAETGMSAEFAKGAAVAKRAATKSPAATDGVVRKKKKRVVTAQSGEGKPANTTGEQSVLRKKKRPVVAAATTVAARPVKKKVNTGE